MFRSVLGIGRSNHVPCEANHPVRFMINHADTHSFLNRDHKLLTSIKLYLVPSIYLSVICASNLSSWSRVRAPALSALDIEEVWRSASAGVGRKVDTPPLGGDGQGWYHACQCATRKQLYAQNPYEILLRFHQTQIYIQLNPCPSLACMECVQ